MGFEVAGVAFAAYPYGSLKIASKGVDAWTARSNFTRFLHPFSARRSCAFTYLGRPSGPCKLLIVFKS